MRTKWFTLPFPARKNNLDLWESGVDKATSYPSWQDHLWHGLGHRKLFIIHLHVTATTQTTFRRFFTLHPIIQPSLMLRGSNGPTNPGSPPAWGKSVVASVCESFHLWLLKTIQISSNIKEMLQWALFTRAWSCHVLTLTGQCCTSVDLITIPSA